MGLTHMIIARVAGAILLVFGMGLATLAIRIVWVQPDRAGAPELSTVVITTVLVVIAAFCLSVGYRLLFNRPNRYGSILSPVGWRLFAAFFVAVAVALATVSIGHDAYARHRIPVRPGLARVLCPRCRTQCTCCRFASAGFPSRF